MTLLQDTNTENAFTTRSSRSGEGVGEPVVTQLTEVKYSMPPHLTRCIT
ncbi:hypothetical protein, unlikely [Trypanosoma brucei brucei TREU927]|uniref:Uncharacterized protein n=1 Tax=Trypanosoma brucei brucei (strain 927/4 GUTat10.1) TaxID=185431 RepID=Q38FD8_TRYB2|nr:hypothetical protein, unlikely [Trypanosoma brucei brucei TREU927]XP_803699.1 hypothetical protein, unlikely [Trypanosoma brucei brucei TREU927]EAN76477.1 hypothetical protein, unlikely [Trypanosoma brucei brucei TREU927]EAN76482.1 hypothetical protein, unlikely [Trypanosoma brucei brucei TREU927]